MFIQVINLDRSVERMRAIAVALDRESVDYTRLSATDGRYLTVSDRHFCSASRSLLYSGRYLKDSEIGCYISHVRAAKALLERGDELGLVLEDDAKLPKDFLAQLERLRRILTHLEPESWEIGNLGKPPTPKYRMHIAHLDQGREVVRAYKFPIRTTAILWTRKGAERFIRNAYPIAVPVDVKLQILSTFSGKGVATVPELIPTTGVVSDIDPGGNPRQGATMFNFSLSAVAMRSRRSILRQVAQRHRRRASSS